MRSGGCCEIMDYDDRWRLVGAIDRVPPLRGSRKLRRPDPKARPSLSVRVSGTWPS
jgi:hypothetical protein